MGIHGNATCVMKIYGGHGYIREWGMEQNLRDAWVTTMYEGRAAIQAFDLLARKILASKGMALDEVIQLIVSSLQGGDCEFTAPLQGRLAECQALAGRIASASAANVDEIGAAAVDHLMYSGYLLQAWMRACMGSHSEARLELDGEGFYMVKLTTARFYYVRILPRASVHPQVAEAESATLMELTIDEF
jgi:hypothetical protein